MILETLVTEYPHHCYIGGYSETFCRTDTMQPSQRKQAVCVYTSLLSFVFLILALKEVFVCLFVCISLFLCELARAKKRLMLRR